LSGTFTAKKIAVDNRIPESLPAMYVDKPKFYRLFELLLKDELASLPEGSTITLNASVVDGGSHKPEIQIQVSDNGPGLPMESLRLVFDPFLVRSDSPLEYGIHLMACYFIVHHHNGRIEAKSDAAHGTTFMLHIPTQPTQSAPTLAEHQFLQKALLND